MTTSPDPHGSSGVEPAALARQRFSLGSITYLIMSDQPSPRSVRCFRLYGMESTIVELPLPFVLEQLAESVDAEPLPV